ncbi:16S rRNA (uracil(1498)-N(3))-methyltransferase [Kocuria sp.]|uniref:16S rRNA (uracil(1498)-N(3))-methyltransferase n=1 Tax=Kocuria sp. TaxID=1871328 RepID=UPI0026DFC2CE|nr:16S rRNA (uracil(1498)-N(3))-methyltransferase [Kocuria sp.]MDO5617698.1 16S rRNA (uracil(1498)-N(3))-methyltransferase [Kocuria sp.]
MSLPVFHAEDPALATYTAGDHFLLTGAEARHAATVRRLGRGELLDVVDGAGTRVTAEVEAASKDSLNLTVRATHHADPPAVRFTLVQALAKGDRDLQAVEACTELGINDVVAWQAERSVARFRPERQHKQLEKWQNTITSAAKQSRRSLWPVLHEPVDTAGLLRLVESSPQTQWWVLHEQAEISLVAGLRAQPAEGAEAGHAGTRGLTDIAVVVGPEGGISEAELEGLTARGARAAVLGPEVLRSSTAGAAAVALLNVVTGRWD